MVCRLGVLCAGGGPGKAGLTSAGRNGRWPGGCPCWTRKACPRCRPWFAPLSPRPAELGNHQSLGRCEWGVGAHRGEQVCGPPYPRALSFAPARRNTGVPFPFTHAAASLASLTPLVACGCVAGNPQPRALPSRVVITLQRLQVRVQAALSSVVV